MNLYELTGAYHNIQTMIEDGTEGLGEALELLDEAIEDKAVGYAKVIKNLSSQASAIKEEETRLSNRRKSLENNITRLKDNLEQAMIFNNKRKIKTDLFSFNVQKNPPSLYIVDSSLIPKNYYEEQAPKLNRRELLNNMKEGEIIDGVEIQQGESLRIR